MSKKGLKVFVYIFFLFVSFIICINVFDLKKDVVNVNFSSNELTTDEVTELLKQDNGNNVFKQEYLKFNNNYDGVEIAGQSDLYINVTNDLVKYSYTSNDLAGFYYSLTSTTSGAMNITKAGGVRNGNNGYLSLPNGTYYFWAFGVNGGVASVKGPATLNNSCRDNVVYNQTGTFNVERCYLVDRSNNVTPANSGTIGTCASGYKMTDKKAIENRCQNLSVAPLNKRYCKVVIQATCTKDGGGNPNPDPNPKPNPNPNPSVPAPKLTSLTVSAGSLSPGFKSGTYNYTVNVDANTSSITVGGNLGSGSNFAGGEGPRVVNLNYGSNVIKIGVVNSQNKKVTYTLNVVRADNRSTVNTLSNLTVKEGTLSPVFSSTVNQYTVEVESNVEKITIDGTLTDNKSSFVPESGPGTYDLLPGPNKIYIKVLSEAGNINIYTLSIDRATTPTECTENPDDYGLLKNIVFSADVAGIEIPQLEDFDAKIFDYVDENGLKVDYKVENIVVKAYADDDADADNIEITGNEDLEVGEPREIEIKVKSNHCPNIVQTYHVEVTRQSEKVKSSVPDLDDIKIKGYEIDFSKEKMSYGIKLKKGDDKLEIELDKEDDGTNCTISGNEDLKVGSKIDISCTAEDGESTVAYDISIDGVEKGTNVFLIILVVVGIILFLGFLLLKLLGYKVVLNFSVVGAFFRGLGEKFNNIFDK